ncbi:MAG: acyl-CoA thioesterase II [Burkholderiaceae bacterium]|jgi:acyl-CoA thioesterase-2|nr:acyl-CoA thioesterase II [Burkholderiaceae bacterium]
MSFDYSFFGAQRLVAQLAGLLQLQDQGGDRFLGQSEDVGNPAVFGGQVLGQALAAAHRTVDPDRVVHSMHAYFLLPGEFVPIEYAVERERDGRSFTTRHVVARQHGRTIFELSASFQAREAGIEHQAPMPDVPPPEALQSEIECRKRALDRLPARWRASALQPRGLEVRPVDPQDDPVAPAVRPAQSQVWMRIAAPLPDDPSMHCELLAYASDHNLLSTGLRPHGVTYYSEQTRMASLDHAMWFHRDFRFDDWLLYSLDSPSANGARMFCRGSFYTRDGVLVASTAQEGVVRIRGQGQG